MKLKLMNFILGVVAFTFVLTGCSSNEDAVSKVIEHNDYSSAVSQNRVLLAQSLAESLNKNPQLASKIITECNKRFDGDKNVLCKNLFEMPLSSSQKIKISAVLNGSSQIQRVKSSFNNSNFTSSIISQDSLVQIYYYTSGSDSTSNSYEGIVILPEDAKERDGKDLLVIKKDGTTTYIRSDIDPDKNYLVISRNERSNLNNSPSQIPAAKIQKITTGANGKNMKIKRATFTSLEAVRSVEDWTRGEPEVRLNILYLYINQMSGKIDELRNCSYKYPENWIKPRFLKKTITKWNEALVDCPFWYSNEKSYGRRLVWIEEDGTSNAFEYKNKQIDPITKAETTFSVSAPATNKDVTIADSWIDYDLVGTGYTYTWSLIQFEISCE